MHRAAPSLHAAPGDCRRTATDAANCLALTLLASRLEALLRTIEGSTDHDLALPAQDYRATSAARGGESGGGGAARKDKLLHPALPLRASPTL
ncbi:hypothetical protein L7F22_034893 [Adiantum nelumboides]|nr:hypothetical protein [Adiantum nelumboides]